MIVAERNSSSECASEFKKKEGIKTIDFRSQFNCVYSYREGVNLYKTGNIFPDRSR